ncbi:MULTISPECIES: YagK/YfjJ domain-containing protein [Acinetobacter]|uniref:Inovirus-type Gp2 protein n=1 Tax=Acinetobacter genomosp. 15BJ TaxID=106651 RepID=A0ABT8V3B4_9GAMM|nr:MULTISPECIES: inovirus-type Gp2 protein [Acinetobacter]MDO3659132.1 inovirus-type Gp2 protein [Acinetobacter genomosp. 15BJ]
MNTDLNPYLMTQNEKKVTMDVEPITDHAEPKEFNEEEAYKQIEFICLVHHVKKSGNNPVYRIHLKRQDTFVIVLKNIHDSLNRIDPFYMEDDTCTSPEADLCRKIFRAVLPQHILADRQTDFWHKSQSDLVAIAPQQFVFKAELINVLCHQLSYAIANDEDYKKAQQLRHAKSLNQRLKAKQLIRKLIHKFSKLLVIRIDFAIYREFKITLELLKNYLRMFIKQLHTPNNAVPPIVGFIWKLEYGIQKGYHYHFIFFMDGNIYKQDTYFADLLGKLWKNITQNKGSYHSCNHDKAFYQKLAIGTLVHNDQEKIDALDQLVVNYLTKTSQFIIEKSQVKQRTFGYSTRNLERSNVGRPRKLLLETIVT